MKQGTEPILKIDGSVNSGFLNHLKFQFYEPGSKPSKCQNPWSYAGSVNMRMVI